MIVIGQENVWVGTWNHDSTAKAGSTCIRNVFFIIIMIFIIHYDIIYVSVWWEGTYLGVTDTPQPASCGKNPSGFYFSGWCRPPVPRSPQPLMFPVQPPMICYFGCGNLILDLNWKNEGVTEWEREKKRERAINKMSTKKWFTLLLSDKYEWKVVLWWCFSGGSTDTQFS